MGRNNFSKAKRSTKIVLTDSQARVFSEVERLKGYSFRQQVYMAVNCYVGELESGIEKDGLISFPTSFGKVTFKKRLGGKRNEEKRNN